MKNKIKAMFKAVLAKGLYPFWCVWYAADVARHKDEGVSWRVINEIHARKYRRKFEPGIGLVRVSDGKVFDVVASD